MNTTQLECFIAVAEFLNFSKAAAYINISQPAVSHQISALEDELGVKLFNRTNKSVRLTVQGMSFISDANEILKIAMSSKSRMSNLNEKKLIRLGIGCHHQAELNMLSPVIRKMSEKHSLFYPAIQVLPFKSLYNLLDENKVDMILTVRDENEAEKSGIYTRLCGCRFAVVCSTDCSLSKRKTIKANEIKERLILIERHKCSQALFNVYGRLGESAYDNIIFADGYESAIALARSGIGAAVLPVFPNNDSEGVAEVMLSDIAEASVGICSKSTEDNPFVQQFINFAKEIYRYY